MKCNRWGQLLDIMGLRPCHKSHHPKLNKIPLEKPMKMIKAILSYLKQMFERTKPLNKVEMCAKDLQPVVEALGRVKEIQQKFTCMVKETEPEDNKVCITEACWGMTRDGQFGRIIPETEYEFVEDGFLWRIVYETEVGWDSVRNDGTFAYDRSTRDWDVTEIWSCSKEQTGYAGPGVYVDLAGQRCFVFYHMGSLVITTGKHQRNSSYQTIFREKIRDFDIQDIINE